jgi:two-component system sensor histidine kinase EvgS
MKALRMLVLAAASVGMQSQPATGEEIHPGQSATVQLTEAERVWVRTHPQVRWGVDPHWPPFSSFNHDHQLIGIDADITRLVAKRVGLRVEPIPASSWAEVVDKAEAGEADFLSAAAEMDGRLESFIYSTSYGSFPVVIVTRTDAPFFTSTRHLGLKKLASKRDDVITLQLQRDFPTAHLVLTDSPEQSFRLLSRGDVDAVVANLAVATRAIRLGALTNLKISGVTRYEFPLRFAVRKDAPELVSILNKGLATITPREEELIYAAHLTPDVDSGRDWGVWRRRALYSVLIGAGIVGAVMGWNCYLAREIKRRKVAEAGLRNARDKLERRTRDLDVRIAEAEQLNRELRVANEDLEAFSSSVSHDLRVPLRRITAYVELLQTETGDGLEGEARNWMSVIGKESRNMDRLIHDLLEFARIGRAELRKEPVNMRHLVESIVNEVQPQLRERRVLWEIGELGEVSGDSSLLRSAMANLIDNSLKYTRHCEVARIRIGGMPDRDDEPNQAVLYVQDNGCGFDMRHAKNIFLPFERLHSSREYEGTGIGLANVQRIVHRHGGQIWFQSEPKKGATFYFTVRRPAAIHSHAE